MPDNGAYGNVWNVVRGGLVIGQVIATSFADAQQIARDVYGAGARPSALADPSEDRVA
jgi:hypothetical protein